MARWPERTFKTVWATRMLPVLARWASGNNDALKVKQRKTFTFNFTLIPNGNVFCNHFFEIVSVIIAKTSLKSKTVVFPFARSKQCALCSAPCSLGPMLQENALFR